MAKAATFVARMETKATATLKRRREGEAATVLSAEDKEERVAKRRKMEPARRCEEELCIRNAAHGSRGKWRFCAVHCPEWGESMRRACAMYGCQMQAKFKRTGALPLRVCAKHAGRLAKRTYGGCKVAGCRKAAMFGTPSAKAVRCGDHREDGMENVVSPRCKCGVQASFGPPGKKKVHCAEHREDGDVGPKQQQCQHRGCAIRPTFGILSRTHCKTHSTPEMRGVGAFYDARRAAAAAAAE